MVGKFKGGESSPQGSHFNLTNDDDEVVDLTPPRLPSVKASNTKVAETLATKQTLWMRLLDKEKFSMIKAIREKLAKAGWKITEIQLVQNRKKASSHQFWSYTNEIKDAPSVRVFHGTSAESNPSIVAQGPTEISLTERSAER